MRPRDVDAQPFPRLAARNWLQRALLWRSSSLVFAALRTPAAVFLNVPGPTNPVGSSADLMLRPFYSKVTTGDTGVRSFDKVLSENSRDQELFSAFDRPSVHDIFPQVELLALEPMDLHSLIFGYYFRQGRGVFSTIHPAPYHGQHRVFFLHGRNVLLRSFLTNGSLTRLQTT